MTDSKNSGITPIVASPETSPTNEIPKATTNADAAKAEAISSDTGTIPDTAPAAVEELPPRAGTIFFRLKPRTRMKIAASVAAAALIGAGIGAMGAAGYAQRYAPVAHPADAAASEVNRLKTLLSQVGTEMATLKVALESSARSTSAQLAKLSDRMERAEKAQAEPVARLARVNEAIERLEKQVAAGAPAFTTASASAAPEITGSIVEKQQQRVDGWVLRDIYDGAALIEGRRGLVEVVPGTMLPGVGRVEQIRRINGRWAVVTSRGVITSSR